MVYRYQSCRQTDKASSRQPCTTDNMFHPLSVTDSRLCRDEYWSNHSSFIFVWDKSLQSQLPVLTRRNSKIDKSIKKTIQVVKITVREQKCSNLFSTSLIMSICWQLHPRYSKSSSANIGDVKNMHNTLIIKNTTDNMLMQALWGCWIHSSAISSCCQ